MARECPGHIAERLADVHAFAANIKLPDILVVHRAPRPANTQGGILKISRVARNDRGAQ